jgi:hypothetical protein
MASCRQCISTAPFNLNNCRLLLCQCCHVLSQQLANAAVSCHNNLPMLPCPVTHLDCRSDADTYAEAAGKAALQQLTTLAHV